ncbi:hypothetical protein [Wenzhouxiangella sediminis]|nr:hypothetical protein [Wenzhouxiangella sediminis]
MNRKPTRKTRQRRRREPSWVERYLQAHEVPEYGSEAYGDLMGFMYHQEPIPGLPEPDSLDARALIAKARPALDAELARARREGIKLKAA